MSGLSRERVGVATAWRFTYLLVQGGLTIALFICFAQVLPAEQFAIAAVAQGVLVMAQALGDFGLSQAAVTVLPARLAADPAASPRLMAGAARLFLTAAAGAAVLCLAAVAVVPLPVRGSVALIAPAAAVAVLMAGADGLLRAVGEFRRPVRLLVLSRSAAFVGLPLAAATDSAAWGCVGLSAGAVAGALPAAGIVVRQARVSGDPDSRPVVRAALPLGISQLLILASGRLDTILVTNLASVTMGAAFESTWRLYQLGQYIAGGVATAAAPFIGHALGSDMRSELVPLLRRGALVVTAVGCGWAVLLLVARGSAGPLLFGDAFGDTVADAVMPLALVTPISFTAFLATITLAASDVDRKFVLIANAGGAVANVGLVLALTPERGAEGAALAAAIGVAVTSMVLLVRFVTLLRRPLGEGATASVNGPR